MKNENKNEKEKEKEKDNLINRAKALAQTLTDKIRKKKITGEQTRGTVKLDRVGLAKGPNTLTNGGKVSK